MGLYNGNMPEPFMEHPTGEFATAVDAMTDAITRLHSLPDWHDWITVGAQGVGNQPDSYTYFEVQLLGNRLKIGNAIQDISGICSKAGLPSGSLMIFGQEYLISPLSARETARLLDSIFRHHGKIRPFPDEKDDYAVGAEW